MTEVLSPRDPQQRITTEIGTQSAFYCSSDSLRLKCLLKTHWQAFQIFANIVDDVFR